MGFLSDLFGGSDAPQQAAAVQQRFGEQAIAETRRATEQARTDLKPFADAGREAIPGLQDLITNPGAQLDYVQNNPFFSALADDAQSRIFNNAAARGKLGSGETAKALQNSMLLLGNELVGQNISQRQNLATLGANAASGQATTAVNAGSNIAGLTAGIGNANAAGIVGAQNARSAGANNLVKTGMGIAQLALSDARTKEDIVPVGETYGGTPLYRYTYRHDEGKTPHIGVLAQQVEQSQPDAVVTIEGVKHVDYARVN